MKKALSVLLVFLLLLNGIVPAWAELEPLAETVEDEEAISEEVVQEEAIPEEDVQEGALPEEALEEAAPEEVVLESDHPEDVEEEKPAEEAQEESVLHVEENPENTAEAQPDVHDDLAVETEELPLEKENEEADILSEEAPLTNDSLVKEEESEEQDVLPEENEEEPVAMMNSGISLMAVERIPNITKFRLSLNELDLLSQFDIFIDWKASESSNTLKEGDYFNILLPVEFHFPNDPALTEFELKNEGGVVIAKAVVTPETSDTPGSVRVTFTENVEEMYNVEGTLKLGSVRFTEKYINEKANGNETKWEQDFKITTGGTSTVLRGVPVSKPDVSQETVMKWGERVTGKPEEVRWMLRLNYSKKAYKGVVVEDELSGIDGISLIPGSFTLQKVSVDDIGRAEFVSQEEAKSL